jgi:polar amino acid transport system permease protein
MRTTAEAGRLWLARMQRPKPGIIALVLAALVVVAVGVWLWLRPAEFETPILGVIPIIARGLPITIMLMVMGSALAAVVALIVGVARTSQSALVRGVTSLYVEFFRGTSILVQMFWIYFVLPSPPFSIRLTAMQAGILALGLNVGAYGAEVVRGAIEAIPPEQIEAARALNMGPGLRMRRIVLPQAMIRILPPFGNLLIELLKATSLASLITLADITFHGRLLIQSVGRMGEVFLVLLVIYFLLAYPLALGVRWLEGQRRWQ